MTDDAIVPAQAVPVKSGWKTSEFWLHALVTIAGLVTMMGLPAESPLVKAAGGVLTLGSLLGYTASRTSVKNAANLLVFAILLGLSLGGCKSLDAKVAKTWQNRETVLMQQLGNYVAADKTKTADAIAGEKTKIASHLLQVQTDITKISPDDENALMSELLAYVNSDPARDADSKQDKGDSIQGHLRLFNDEIK